MASETQIIDALKAVVEDGKVRTDAETLESHGKDWTKIYAPKPLAIVFPKTTEEVQAIVKLANEHEFALVPSGGRTGLSAGAVASNG
ncbi:FAD-binding oxidoreductase, partial [Oleiphilus sp. HI0061]